MNKILIAYVSRAGTTQKMAEYLAEGCRMSGHDVDVVKTSQLQDEKDFAGYDGFLFGCPTYHKDMTNSMKQFLFLVEKANLTGKFGGSFGSHTHSGEAAPMIFETMQHVFKMDVLNLGPLSLTESMMQTDEGLKACHHYAKSLAEKFSR